MQRIHRVRYSDSVNCGAAAAALAVESIVIKSISISINIKTVNDNISVYKR